MKSRFIYTLYFTVILCLFVQQVQAQQYDFVVAKDGSGDFKTVQEAINAVPDFRKNQTTIFSHYKIVLLRLHLLYK